MSRCSKLIVSLALWSFSFEASAQTLITQYTFDGVLTNSSTFMDNNGLPPDGTFMEGTLVSTPTYVLGVDGTIGSALLLDGVDDWVNITAGGHPGQSVPSTAGAGPGLVSGTVMAWVKMSNPANSGSQYLMGSANTNDYQAFHVGWNNTRIESLVHGSDGASEGSLLADSTHDDSWFDGDWHHVAVAWDNFFSSAQIYLDGNMLGASALDTQFGFISNQTAWEAGSPMAIGARNNGGNLEGFWDGAIDDLRVYADRLDESEIQAIIDDTPQAQFPDFDGDNDVDLADLMIWQRGYGGSGGFATGDANNSGLVDDADLLLWQTHFGEINPISAIGAVPEPSSGLIALVGMLVTGLRRRTTKA